MLKQYQRVVGGFFRTIDIIVIGLTWLLSYYLRFYLLPVVEITKGTPPFQKYFALMPLVMMLWIVTFSIMKVYHSKRMLRRTDEAHLLLKAHGAALIVFIALTYMISEYKYSRAVILYFAILGAFFLVFFRLVLRNSLRKIRKRGYNLRHVIIVGDGPVVEHLIWRIEKFPELGLRILGVIVPDISHVQKETNPKREVNHKPVLGSVSEIKSIIQKHGPDQVIVALPRSKYERLDFTFKELANETIDLYLIPDIHEFVTIGCEVEYFEGLPFISVNDSPLNGWAIPVKRMTDVTLGLIALLIFGIPMAIITLLIKLTSKGPIFYFQERMGLDGRTFQMIKFRTMKIDAESKTGAVWAVSNDERKTSIGSFLRKTSLDELPQLFNVLLGQMSLVGPRPERPVFVDKFRDQIPHYMLRHKVKAGMTGWAQINGWRGNTSLDRRIEFDLYYIRNWTFGLDIKILLLTVWKGFIHKHAY